jgi:hypothetical protein
VGLALCLLEPRPLHKGGGTIGDELKKSQVVLSKPAPPPRADVNDAHGLSLDDERARPSPR